MSLRHIDKCTKAEAQQFRAIVEAWLVANEFPFSQLRALTAYGGEVRIYSGEHPTRPSRKRVLQHDGVGYYLGKTQITEAQFFQTYQEEWDGDKPKPDEEELINIIKNEWQRSNHEKP